MSSRFTNARFCAKRKRISKGHRRVAAPCTGESVTFMAWRIVQHVPPEPSQVFLQSTFKKSMNHQSHLHCLKPVMQRKTRGSKACHALVTTCASEKKRRENKNLQGANLKSSTSRWPPECHHLHQTKSHIYWYKYGEVAGPRSAAKAAMLLSRAVMKTGIPQSMACVGRKEKCGFSEHARMA